jgi:hypothetical protein
VLFLKKNEIGMDNMIFTLLVFEKKHFSSGFPHITRSFFNTKNHFSTHFFIPKTPRKKLKHLYKLINDIKKLKRIYTKTLN